MNRLLILVIVSAWISSCHQDIHFDLIFKNLSQKGICISLSDSYPDTTLECPWGYYSVGGGKEYKLPSRNGWENEFKSYNFLQVFVIDSAICSSNPCDSIKKYHNILKRYQLSLDDIEKSDWTITFP